MVLEEDMLSRQRESVGVLEKKDKEIQDLCEKLTKMGEEKELMERLMKEK